MKYDLAIFDMDGTILDTLEDLSDSLNYALRECGLTERSENEVRSFLGNGMRVLIEKAAPHNTSPEILERLYNTFYSHYTAHCHDKTKPYNGIEEMLKELRMSGCMTAVVSNKNDGAVRILCNEYFDGMFDMALGSSDGVRRKPFPDLVNAVLAKLNIDRSRAVYIGDSEVDIETAKNSGMDCISVLWGFRSLDYLRRFGLTQAAVTPQEITELILRS